MHFSPAQQFCLSLLLSILPAVSIGQVYQWQDHNKTFYADHPYPGAKIIPIKASNSYYKVKRVIDGDTLQLDNGDRIRLLSINTPEVGGRYKSTEAGGEQAKQWLKARLQNQKVHLETDTEQQDKYKRTLAYVFTEAGEHINLELVRNGYASVNIYPPNLKYVHYFIQAEQAAEQQQLGIWKEPAYAVKPIEQIDLITHGGWQRLSGTARTIHTSTKYVYINFSKNFSIRIARANLALFPDLNRYLGHKIEVRGWLNQQQSGYSMLIRHPHAIHVLH